MDREEKRQKSKRRTIELKKKKLKKRERKEVATSEKNETCLVSDKNLKAAYKHIPRFHFYSDVQQWWRFNRKQRPRESSQRTTNTIFLFQNFRDKVAIFIHFLFTFHSHIFLVLLFQFWFMIAIGRLLGLCCPLVVHLGYRQPHTARETWGLGERHLVGCKGDAYSVQSWQTIC